MPHRSHKTIFTRDFWLVSTSHFLFGMSIFLFVLFPVFLEGLGAGKTEIGLIIGIAAASAILVRPIVGSQLDLRGRRMVLIIGGLVNVIASLFYLTIESLGAEVYLVRILHGIGIGTLFSTFFTVASDIVPFDRRTEGIALFGISGLLPLAIAPILGEEIVNRWGFVGFFWAAVALSVFSFAASFYVREPVIEAGLDGRGHFFRVVLKRRLAMGWVVTVCFGLVLACYFSFIATFAKSIGLTRVAPFFIMYSVSAVSLRLFGAKIPDRMGITRVLVVSLTIFAFGVAMISFGRTPYLLGLAGLLCGTGHGYLFPILTSLAVSRTVPQNRGAAVTFYTALFDVGFLFGAPVFGAVADAWGYVRMFQLAGAVMFASAVAFRLFDRP